MDEEYLGISEQYKTLKKDNPQDPKLKNLLKQRNDLLKSGKVSRDTVFAASLL